MKLCRSVFAASRFAGDVLQVICSALLRRVGVPSAKAVLRSLVLVVVGSIASTSQSTPITLTTPPGLSPGDHFRYVFVTAGVTSATSVSISAYNSFVSSQSNDAQYNGSTVSWYAIGSTPTTNARDNVGGFGTAVPVFLVTGTRVADSLTTSQYGFWSGVWRNNLNAGIDGSTMVDPTGLGFVWSGTDDDGNRLPGYELSVGYPAMGYEFQTANPLRVGARANNRPLPMFAMSAELTAVAVPEPSTWVTALAGLACGGYSVFRRRKRA